MFFCATLVYEVSSLSEKVYEMSYTQKVQDAQEMHEETTRWF
jgi:hypothetical protein